MKTHTYAHTDTHTHTHTHNIHGKWSQLPTLCARKYKCVCARPCVCVCVCVCVRGLTPTLVPFTLSSNAFPSSLSLELDTKCSNSSRDLAWLLTAASRRAASAYGAHMNTHRMHNTQYFSSAQLQWRIP